MNTIDTITMHNTYEDAAEPTQEAIGNAFQAAADALKASGFKLDMADPAEELVAALTHFLVRSGNDLGHRAETPEEAERQVVEAGDDYGMF